MVPFIFMIVLFRFTDRLEREVVRERLWGQTGAPWEFNLRDLLR